MTKPVVIEYTAGERKGETYVVTSAAKAKAVHPDAKIIRHEDGTPYEPPKAET